MLESAAACPQARAHAIAIHGGLTSLTADAAYSYEHLDQIFNGGAEEDEPLWITEVREEPLVGDDEEEEPARVEAADPSALLADAEAMPGFLPLYWHPDRGGRRAAWRPRRRALPAACRRSQLDDGPEERKGCKRDAAVPEALEPHSALEGQPRAAIQHWLELWARWAGLYRAHKRRGRGQAQAPLAVWQLHTSPIPW